MPQISPLYWGFSSFFMVMVFILMVVMIEWGGVEEVPGNEGSVMMINMSW